MSEIRSYPIGREFSKEDYIKAFKSIKFRTKIHENVLQTLQTHFSALERKMTPPQLAESVSYRNYNAVNLHYGKLGRMVCEELGYIPPNTQQGDPTWTCGLA